MSLARCYVKSPVAGRIVCVLSKLIYLCGTVQNRSMYWHSFAISFVFVVSPMLWKKVVFAFAKKAIYLFDGSLVWRRRDWSFDHLVNINANNQIWPFENIYVRLRKYSLLFFFCKLAQPESKQYWKVLSLRKHVRIDGHGRTIKRECACTVMTT